MDEEKILAQGKIDLGRVYLEIEGDTPTANLQEKSVTITTNTETNVTPDEGYDGLSEVTVTTNVEPTLQSVTKSIYENGEMSIEPDEGYDGISSVSLTVAVPTEDYSKYGYPNGIPLVTEQLPIMDAIQTAWSPSNTSAYRLAYQRTDIIIFPYIDTSNVTNIREMFDSCARLVQIPELDFSKVTNNNHYHAFSACYYLDKDSINTILLMCSKMSLITSNKTLSYMGVVTNTPYLGDITQYSNYQAFIQAGWTIS